MMWRLHLRVWSTHPYVELTARRLPYVLPAVLLYLALLVG